jgi:hypothetical protein
VVGQSTERAKLSVVPRQTLGLWLELRFSPTLFLAPVGTRALAPVGRSEMFLFLKSRAFYFLQSILILKVLLTTLTGYDMTTGIIDYFIRIYSMPAIDHDLERRFTYHAPVWRQTEKYTALRGQAKHFAYRIKELVPEGREMSLALTKLEEVIFWANAGISREELVHEIGS